MTGEPTVRMTGSEVQCAREALGLERVDLARLLGNGPTWVRDWERGKSFVPFRVREQIGELESQTDQAVAALVAELRQMPQPRAVVYREGEQPADGDVARFGRKWWRAVVTRAVAQVPETRVGTQADFDAMDHEE